jgi:uncharacterized protein
MPAHFEIEHQLLEALCQRWKIKRLWLFGSILRNDFHAGSDIDLLVEFGRDADWSLLDHVEMEQEFSDLLGRPVDVVTRRAVEQSKNTLRRDAILNSAELVYVAG